MSGETMQLYEDSNHQLSLLPIPSTVQKTRSDIVDSIMVQELSEQEREMALSEWDDAANRIRTKVVISYDDLGSGDDRLNAFDLEVIEAVATFAEEGRDYISSAMIYRLITGKQRSGKVSESNKQKVAKSMEKCLRTTVNIDITDDLRRGNFEDVSEGKFFSSIISFERAFAKSSMGTIDCYRILSVPTIFRFAKQIGKVSEFPISVIDTPPSKTNTIILMQSYLLRRIDRMNRNMTAERDIPWKDIFEAGDVKTTSRSQLARYRSVIQEILDYWVGCGLIRSYRADHTTRGTIRIVPNHQAPEQFRMK